ncbi:putative lipoprotein LprQ [Pseudonocardia sp. Ae168_Ps1]|uniref:L,D-transpeptidase n=1 Tax=unclassified Pseudonocardia TaxID=2619320 RepID=UPI00094ADD6C|nr:MULTISPECIES: Ig-like domain-containing protein [unclassified Pseudonocardia]OLL72699.1 putative lipoprotein LprQ [Pseudonocardia sp. Ae150A_Ps1]OLL78670.1 putative lipoprotein LprQ [Pseudonocardia sp. Ae168_Ps1]OLL87201.1 putative lipoprotein LprQ [Pseudonocardia sp. Ae263_Ps1]OLL92769.1 putative lipoprotein LprQ [Pseudonocardia sp. Ae356_Ps1]
MSRSWERSRGRHTPRGRRRSLHRRSLALFTVGLVALVALVAGGTAAVAEGRIGGTVARDLAGVFDRFGLAPEPEAPPVPVVLSTSPRPGPPVAPRDPATAEVSTGRLENVALTGDDGPVAGRLSPDGRRWTSTDPLEFGTTYRWSGSWVVTGDDRRPLAADPFTTVDPADTLDATMNVRDGGEVGVGAPIVLRFPGELSDAAKAAVERTLRVETSKPVEGAWAWLPDTAEGSRVHYRPRTYWPAHTTVRVHGALRGTDLGDGTWATEDVDRTFTVGRSQIVKADTRSHQIVVVRDGKEIARYDASYGMESDPNRVTRSGTHVVMGKSEKVLMTNEAYGYVDEPQYWAVRISNNGEFIHANPSSSYAQGNRNVSHGCVNLSTKDGKAFFAMATFGDPVEVTGSSEPLTQQDGDFYDWTIPWDEWTSMSALT